MDHLGLERLKAFDHFDDARCRAQVNRVWRKLTKKRQTLLPFAPIHRQLSSPSRINRGVQEIPVENIVGSVDRASEFDRDFRPLHKNQRQRWANVWALHAQKGWEPIVVYRLGDLYFVEDGHHRVSVAHDLGLELIEAVVISYPTAAKLAAGETLAQILGRREKELYPS